MKEENPRSGARQFIAIGVARSQGKKTPEDLMKWVKESSMLGLYNVATDLEVAISEQVANGMMVGKKAAESVKSMDRSQTFIV